MGALERAFVRGNFGWRKRILVSPQFHRVHHGVIMGHQGPSQHVNFGVVLAFWDKLFATADFRDAYPATGVADHLHGQHYGDGFWETQWLGFIRLNRLFWPR